MSYHGPRDNGEGRPGDMHRPIIDGLRKTGDAVGHKTDPCGAGNDHFFCPTKTPKISQRALNPQLFPE